MASGQQSRCFLVAITKSSLNHIENSWEELKGECDQGNLQT